MKLIIPLLFFIGYFNLVIAQPKVQLTPFAERLDAPISMAATGNNTLYVVQRAGTIVILDNGQVSKTFLDISNLVSTKGEGGLLDMAFHPDYEQNKTFYVNFTAEDEEEMLHTYIAQVTVPQDSSSADPDSMKILMDIVQPFDNHNGGQILFGPDSNLYIFTGDGGSGGDPEGNAQDLLSPLGKILRIDVRPDTASAPYYVVPESNPFAFTDQALPEIWAIGLRNPWKVSFDRETDSLWVADVGQGLWEEISVQNIYEAEVNYGWNCMEGNVVYEECDETSSFLSPVYVYGHSNKENCEDPDFCGQSVTGGYVYRGNDYPALYGHYIFADFVSNHIWTLDTKSNSVTLQDDESINGVSGIVSFFEDPDGELYLVSLGGTIYKVSAEDVTTALGHESYEKISITPNPVSNELNLNISEFDKAQIFSMDGKLMNEYQSPRNTINVSALPNGTYFIKISKNNQRFVGKFVKL